MMGLHLLLSRFYSGSEACATRNMSRISNEDEDEEWSINNVNLPFPEKRAVVVGSCNGLVCLEYWTKNEDEDEDEHEYWPYVVWNPSTDTFQRIPPSTSLTHHPCDECRHHITSVRARCRRRSYYGEMCALGFDAESQDYKFVRSVSNSYESYPGYHGGSTQVEVYSLRNNSWKEVRFPLGDCSNTTVAGVYINGFCYWYFYPGNIASFDFSNHKFSTFPCPEFAQKVGCACRLFLFELHGSLGVVIYSYHGITKFFTFWIYAAASASASASASWTRQIELDVRLVGAEKVLWFGKNGRNGESLLLQGVDGALLEYDYTVRRLKRIDQIHDFWAEMKIFPYVDTNHVLP